MMFSSASPDVPYPSVTAILLQADCKTPVVPIAITVIFFVVIAALITGAWFYFSYRSVWLTRTFTNVHDISSFAYDNAAISSSPGTSHPSEADAVSQFAAPSVTVDRLSTEEWEVGAVDKVAAATARGREHRLPRIQEKDESVVNVAQDYNSTSLPLVSEKGIA